MRVAMEWSRRGQGWTSPRPSVGCALVRDEKLIGAGHTTPGNGNPHAEVVALNQARAARASTHGATAYVTLEPCSHFATTPPCTHALIEAGIARVVAGVRDPNPAVDGRGYTQLRAAGIEVVENFLADECARLHEQFLKHIVHHAPFVTLKIAASLDGKIALPCGESQWITGEAARRRAQMLRHEHDAVLVGIETALHDDPRLNVRLDGEWKQPARVVLDSRGRLPLTSKLAQDTSTPLFVATTEAMPEEKRKQLEARGAQLLLVPRAEHGVDLKEVLDQLYQHGVFSVLIEGGARVASSALRAHVVDKVAWFTAPIFIGQGRDALGEYSLKKLSDAPRLRDVQLERLGDDVLTSGYIALAPAFGTPSPASRERGTGGEG
jgi:diaminohydroxyphosphoribosylaminopyrimidine deaminase/5-amino-6-(5-phosphoribosylamino)uracil reductase